MQWLNSIKNAAISPLLRLAANRWPAQGELLDVQTRLSLWLAFSRFFLDTELSNSDFAEVAKVINESGVALSDAEAVLWNEVFPVLSANLQAISGEWAGWSAAWLQANLRPSTGPARRRYFGLAARETRRCWQRVCQPGLGRQQRPAPGLLNVALQLLYGLSLLLLWALSGPPQAWMMEFDPSITAAAIEDHSGDRAITQLLLLLLALAVQAAIAIRASSHAGRILALLLATVALLLFSCG